MKKCPYCGHENPDEIFICVKCKAGIPHEEELEKAEEVEETERHLRRRKK